MKLFWSPEALQDLADIRAYIAQDDPVVAKKVVQRVVSLLASQLTANPNSGRIGRVPGTRELVIARTPFVVPYRLRRDAIEILRVYHAARLWPTQL